jgi:hypothetical protein
MSDVLFHAQLEAPPCGLPSVRWLGIIGESGGEVAPGANYLAKYFAFCSLADHVRRTAIAVLDRYQPQFAYGAGHFDVMPLGWRALPLAEYACLDASSVRI